MRVLLAVMVVALSVAAGTASAAGDFSLSVDPSVTALDAGGTTSVAVSVTDTSASAPDVISLSATGLPSGVTATFAPSEITGSGSATHLHGRRERRGGLEHGHGHRDIR